MTLNNSQMALFAATITAGIGAALMVQAGWSGGSGVAGNVGAMVSLTGIVGMVVGGTYGTRSGELGPFSAVLAVLLGCLTVWFWLVPGRIGYMAVACEADNLRACTASARHGGFAQRIAYDNERWVESRCIAGDAEICRLAAAKRLIHPSKFCSKIGLSDEFTVIEWCTRGADGKSLVARR